MDAAVSLTNDTDADGEAVWSWRPDAGVKFGEFLHQATVANKPGHRGATVLSRPMVGRAQGWRWRAPAFGG